MSFPWAAGDAAPLSLFPSLATAVSAFCATNLDDIVLLLLFFSQLERGRTVTWVVMGQYLGFGLLVLVSLLGCVGHAMVPEAWLGLLGLLPISLGVTRLMEVLAGEADDPSAAAATLGGRSGPWAEVLAVAAVTVANGSDNVGVYMPMFAHADVPELGLILAVFALMMGLWCRIAWRLTGAPGLAPILRQYGDQLIPFVLIGLGGLILFDSHILAHRGLAVIALSCVGVMVLSITRQLAAITASRPSLQRLP